MKDLLSKEHYCYRHHTSSTKSSAYPIPCLSANPIYGLPCPIFTRKCSALHLYDFSKVSPPPSPYKQGGCGVGVHTMKNVSQKIQQKNILKLKTFKNKNNKNIGPHQSFSGSYTKKCIRMLGKVNTCILHTILIDDVGPFYFGYLGLGKKRKVR